MRTALESPPGSHWSAASPAPVARRRPSQRRAGHRSARRMGAYLRHGDDGPAVGRGTGCVAAVADRVEPHQDLPLLRQAHQRGRLVESCAGRRGAEASAPNE
eukprot:scaffold299_cov343-Prasinococcus_capsulatus_cf.AAC.16